MRRHIICQQVFFQLVYNLGMGVRILAHCESCRWGFIFSGPSLNLSNLFFGRRRRLKTIFPYRPSLTSMGNNLSFWITSVLLLVGSLSNQPTVTDEQCPGDTEGIGKLLLWHWGSVIYFHFHFSNLYMKISLCRGFVLVILLYLGGLVVGVVSAHPIWLQFSYYSYTVDVVSQ